LNSAQSIAPPDAADWAQEPTSWKLLDRLRQVSSERPALAVLAQDAPPVRLSYGELHERVGRAAAALVEHGIGRGDNVAVMMGNRPEWAVLELAVTGIGARLVPVNTRFKSAEVQYLLEQSHATALFLEPMVATADVAAVVAEAIEALSGDSDSLLLVELGKVTIDGAISYDEWERGAATDPGTTGFDQAGAEVEPDDLAIILYTSGTTGRPKGASLSHRSVFSHMSTLAAHLQIRPEDSFLVSSPMFFVTGCIVGLGTALTTGARVVLLDLFDPDRALEVIESEGVTVTGGTPTQYISMLASPRFPEADLSSLKRVTIGGASSPVALIREMIERMEVRVVSSYGLSEAASCNTWTELDDPPELVAETVGHAAPDNEVAIFAPDTRERCTPGETGELCIRGTPVMSGYLGLPEETEKAIDQGWLRTGDLAVADQSGYIKIVDRLKDMYVCGGMNVYPAEVESTIFSMEEVQQAYVVGAPDDRLGEIGVAFVQPRAGAELDPPSVIDYCRERLANYKAPRRVVITDDFPLTASGKVIKRELSKRAVDLPAASEARSGPAGTAMH
jgi:acyl-CoA synthetase (AMP-forming)/AMP-acid ligase II